QLGYFVDPERLFSHYVYASGTSRTLGEYFAWFADQVVNLVGTGAKILEIGCNDGSLMLRLAERGLRVRGVDPARNLVAHAHANGLDVVCDLWPTNTLGDTRFDLVVAQNVLAHNSNPLAFLKKIGEALSDRGICVVQTSQAAMLSNGEFDTIYHEHCS